MIGDAGEIEAGRRRDQRLLRFEIQLAAAVNVEVETVQAGGDDNVERLFERAETFRDFLRGVQGPDSSGARIGQESSS